MNDERNSDLSRFQRQFEEHIDCNVKIVALGIFLTSVLVVWSIIGMAILVKWLFF